MKIFYLLILLISGFHALNSQGIVSRLPVRPFEQIKYKGTNPKWHHTFYLANHVTDTTDGYGTPYFADQILDFENDDNTIVTPEGIYQAYYYKPFWGGGSFTGSYIEKLDLNTGALIWRKFIGNPQGMAEFVRVMKINQSNQLVLINQQSINDDQDYLDLILSIRVLDSKTGQELSYASASSVTGLRMPFSTFGSESELFCEDDCKKIRYTTNHVSPNNISAKTYTSKVINTSTSQSDIDFDTLYSANLIIPFEIKQLEDESFFISVLDTAKRRFNFKVMEPDFTPKYEYISDVFPKWMYDVRLRGFDQKSRSILFSYQNPINFPIEFSPSYDFYKVDGQGKMSDKYFMPNKYELGNYHPLRWKQSDTIYMINANINYTKLFSPDTRVYNTLDILRCIPGDTCRIVKTYLSADSLRVTGNFSVHEIDGDDVYLRFYEGSLYKDASGFKFDTYARAMSGMRISVSELINGTSSINEWQIINDVICYPNPANDLLNIELPDLSSGQTTVFDMSGKVVSQNTFTDQKNLSFDIADLHQGSYEIIIMCGQSTTYRTRFVKM